MKNEKNYMGFLIHKIQQILKHFAERKPLIYEEWTAVPIQKVGMKNQNSNTNKKRNDELLLI